MTQPQFADRVGAAAVTGPPRLWTDPDHDTVPLGILERVCQVLDLHPTELFAPPARAAQRRAVTPVHPPADATVVEAALATLTAPSGQAGSPVSPARLADALGWPLARLATALVAVEDRLADTGIRLDRDPAPTAPPLRGLRARDRYLTDEQRVALHRLRSPDPTLDAQTARILAVLVQAPRVLTERDLSLDPAAVVALQQRGLIRRHHRGGYLELAEDAQFSLTPTPPTTPPPATDIYVTPTTDTTCRFH